MGLTERARAVFAAAWVFLAATTPLPAFEVEEVLAFSVGPVIVHPQGHVGQMYDDNIFFRERHRAGDFITRLSPAVVLRLGRLEENHLLLDYRYDHSIYWKNRDLDAGDHSLGLLARMVSSKFSLHASSRGQWLSGLVGAESSLGQFAGAEIVVADPATGEIIGTGNFGVDPNTGQIVLGENLGRKIERQIQVHDLNLEYTLSEKTEAYLQGTYQAVDFERGAPLFDSNTLRGTAGFSYQPFTKVKLFGETYYGQTSVNANRRGLRSPHVEFIGGYLGAEGAFSARLTGVFKVGYEAREFAGEKDTPGGIVAELALQHRFSERRAAMFTSSRRTGISIESSGLTFTSQAVGLGLTQSIGSSGKIRLTLNGSFAMDSYDSRSSARPAENYWYRANLQLSYQMRLWLSGSFGYQYEKLLTPGKASIDYDVNRVTLTLTIGY